MDRWGIKSYNCIGGDETPNYTAQITLDKKVVGCASNSGRGGPDMFSFKAKLQKEQFMADVKSWWNQFATMDVTEPESLWVDWVAHYKTHITAEDYISQVVSMIQEVAAT